jgi:hypothetical protein
MFVPPLQAFLSAFISYYLIKFVPFWELSLLSTIVIYLGPLIYIKNKDVIDGQMVHASNVVSAQTAQIKGIAGERTSKGFESVKHYTGDYAAKAQVLMNDARQKIPSAAGATQQSTQQSTSQSASQSTQPFTQQSTQQAKPAPMDANQFPAVPRSEPMQDQAGTGLADRPVAAQY